MSSPLSRLSAALGLLGLLLFAGGMLTRKALPNKAHSHAYAQSAWNLPGKAPHLLAHYVSWFQIDRAPDGKSAKWVQWKYSDQGPHHDPENRLPNGRRDIASVNYPLIGPYDSRSRAVIRYHLATMTAAGIEGIIVDWYGKGSPSDRPMSLLLQEAERLGMRVGICYEEKMNFLWRNVKSRAEAVADAEADLKYAAGKYCSHPAYLRRGGLPVFIQFDGWGEGPIGPKMFSPQELQRILDSLPVRVSYCRQGLVPQYHPPIPGAFQWWSTSSKQLRDFGESARKMVQDGRLQYFGNMIAPGFDDTGVWGWGGGPRKTSREGLSLLRHTFDLCFSGDPEFVQMVTWNDFNEGTAFEPTLESGFQYLDAVATWWAERNGRRPDLKAIREPFLTYVNTCSAAERAELPPAPYDRYLERKSLAVAVPNYLDVLAKQAGK